MKITSENNGDGYFVVFRCDAEGCECSIGFQGRPVRSRATTEEEAAEWAARMGWKLSEHFQSLRTYDGCPLHRSAMPEPQPRKLYGFFSTVHRGPGRKPQTWKRLDGIEVEVTAVSASPEAPEYEWTDKQCMGEVTHLVR